MAKWLMVEDNLHRREALVAARVPFTELKIGRPRTIEGLAFPEEEKARVLEILGLGGAQLREAETDQNGVFLLEVSVPRVVREAKENLEWWGELEPVLAEYASILGLEVRVSNPHNKSSAPRAEAGRLYVRFWSAPTGAEQRVRFVEAFGIALVEGQRDGCAPSGQGIIVTDPAGVAVAEVIGGTLYVLFDLPHGENAGKLLRAIMEQYVLLQKSPEEQERFLREQTERERQRSREAYAKECGRRLASVRQEAEKDMREAEQTLENASRQIVEQTRRLDGSRMKIRQLDESGKAMAVRFAEEYDKLLQVPHVRRVGVRDGVVSVFTDTIYLEYGGNRYELGDYRIDIGSNGALRIQNIRVRELTNQDFYHHPHVFRDGGGDNTCLGNIREGVYRLIGSYEYSVAAQVLIEYLHTMTTGHGEYSSYLTINWKPLPAAGKEVK